MKWEEKPDEPVKLKTVTKEGKPLRILSTSLGLALLANAALSPGTTAAANTAGDNEIAQPKLVEWSSEEVKSYYDPEVDWNIPLPEEENTSSEQAENSGESVDQGGQGGTTIINTSSGFGWNDLILYHLLFNSGSSYSSRSWNNSHPTYYAGTSRRYQAQSYNNDTFQNKPVAGSTVRPKTANKTGTVTRRSTSSSPGGIGGKSSGFSSSKSTSSRSSGGFGG